MRFAATLMTMPGAQGADERDAWLQNSRALAADTPGHRWAAADRDAGRASILRLLGLEPDSAASRYAAEPFRTIVDDTGRTWLGGAIGAPGLTDIDASHADIRDVVLWDPRTGDTRIMGEHGSSTRLLLPDDQGDRLAIYRDAREFFQAWAARRVETLLLIVEAGRGGWQHPVSEPSDSGLPGALIVGGLATPDWRRVRAGSVVPCRGLNPKDIRDAMIAAMNLPNIEGGTGGRV